MLIHDSRFSVDGASSAIDPGTGLATFNGYHFADSPEVTAFFEAMIASAEMLPERQDDWLPAVPFGHEPGPSYKDDDQRVNSGIFTVEGGIPGDGLAQGALENAGMDGLDGAPAWLKIATSAFRHEHATAARTRYDRAAEGPKLRQDLAKAIINEILYQPRLELEDWEQGPAYSVVLVQLNELYNDKSRSEDTRFMAETALQGVWPLPVLTRAVSRLGVERAKLVRADDLVAALRAAKIHADASNDLPLPVA